MIRLNNLLVAGASALAITSAASAQEALPQATDSYFTAAREALQQHLANTPIEGEAKNVILFVGDGMSIATVTAARIYDGQSEGVDGESHSLAIDTFPYVALSRTYSHDGQVSDSAPTATAMVTGVKTRNDVIGVDQTVPVGDCAAMAGHEVQTLLEMAEAAGLSTGVISTARLTHATPAAMYAHTPHRDWEDDTAMADRGGTPGGECRDIADQLVNWESGDGFEVALGGGRSYFLPDTIADPEDEGKMGHRSDGRDLTQEWVAKGNNNVFVWNSEGLNEVDWASGAKVLGLFEGSHMEYEADRAEDVGGEPSIAELTEAAITRLQQDEDGFVLMVEGGRIDHAHHAGNAARALIDAVAFDDAVAKALELTSREDTLIVVTADHSHTMTINGYPKRGNPILGVVVNVDDEVEKAADGTPYTTLSYANGPGGLFPGLADGQTTAEGAGVRPDPSTEDTTSIDYLQQAAIPMASETHAGDDVAIFAWGPFAHLFSGVVEQNYIYHVLAHASQIEQRSAAALDVPTETDTASAN